MISSRRLAREWALKILYQLDVAHPEPEEAFESALERLRREFVLRGSRSASGSATEEVVLELVTTKLRDTLSGLRLPFERAATYAVERICEEQTYWQEVRLEKSIRTQFPGVILAPARLQTPMPDSAVMPMLEPSALEPAPFIALSPEERARLRRFVAHVREELPRLLEPEFRTLSRKTARAWADARPESPALTPRYVQERREEFVAAIQERWRKIGAVAQKQTGDWLRTAAFTVKLARGTHEHVKPLDATLGALSSGWRMERQVAVDRNILRMAGFEMLHLPGIPTGASINEAVELAKKYSTQESGRFVNGVLGALAQQVGDKLTPPADVRVEIESDMSDELLDLPDIADDLDDDVPVAETQPEPENDDE